MNQHKNLRYGLAALLVLAVFAVGILGTLLGGAGIYQRLTWRDQTAFNSRTCAQYIATRVRQASGTVEVACFGGVDALVIPESIQGETYLTRVYCYDSWLMELFAAESGSFEPQDGEKLLPAQALASISMTAFHRLSRRVSFTKYRRHSKLRSDTTSTWCIPRQANIARPSSPRT